MSDYATFIAAKRVTWQGESLPVSVLPSALFDWLFGEASDVEGVA